jgi:hypothetical protein
MASKKQVAREPNARVVIEYYDEGVEVTIDHFERLTPGKIQRSLDYVITKWQQLQLQAVNANRAQTKEKENGTV